MFEKILIANRGEIACRVARTARRLGIRTVAVYSEADARALHVAMCDEAILIGPPHPRESYLRMDRILDAAIKSGAQAVHPGYGFLSENAAFARACGSARVTFIGPPAPAIEAMGSKSAAKTLMEKAGVPLVPGYHGDGQDLGLLRREAERIGYPVLIKASAGGGGKGMRVVLEAAGFADALAGARREAASSFGDDRVLIEKYLTRPRHIEVQVFADNDGGVVHLYERDCSVQRRHQKILEEAPAPGMTSQRRREMGEAAIAAAKAVGYVSAGTVEFIVDEDGRFYFMEMNTRLQVEHPVTEMITGLDLVEWQLRVAGGERLPLSQEQIALSGHAIEARVYAEDPARDFLPAAGMIEHLRQPAASSHVRVDAGVQAGDEVGVHYDPMIAKVIAWDVDRPSALRRLRAALGEFEVTGLITNLSFLSAVTAHPSFSEAHRDPGLLDIGLIERHREELFPECVPASDSILAIAALGQLLQVERDATAAAARSADPHSPWNSCHGWRLNQDDFATLVFLDGDRRVEIIAHYRDAGYLVELPGGPLTVAGEESPDGRIRADLGGNRVHATVVRRPGEMTVFAAGASHRLATRTAAAVNDDEYGARLVSPLPGNVVEVMVREGDAVEKGQVLMIIEAMKMEHTIVAPHAGTVRQIYFAAGEQVSEGAQLLEFEDAVKS
jgi:3-methylcrotonyl-CoA carboxylase alpha subunit